MSSFALSNLPICNCPVNNRSAGKQIERLRPVFDSFRQRSFYVDGTRVLFVPQVSVILSERIILALAARNFGAYEVGKFVQEDFHCISRKIPLGPVKTLGEIFVAINRVFALHHDLSVASKKCDTGSGAHSGPLSFAKLSFANFSTDNNSEHRFGGIPTVSLENLDENVKICHFLRERCWSF